MAISIGFKDKYVYFGPEAGLHTQGEARAEVYDVTGPRYHDGHDLSAMTWYVRASHPDYMTIINKQLRVSVDPDNEGQIIITWPVDADFTAYSGQLDVQFVAKSSTGEEIIKLQSNGLQFAASVEGTVIPPRNMFETAVEQIGQLADEAANAAAQSKLDAGRAEDAQEAAAQSAQQAQKSVQDMQQSVKDAAELVKQIEGDAESAAASASDAAENASISKDWAAGKPIAYSGTPVSIAYAGANRIDALNLYGENAQGGTTEAPVALTGISSVTLNDDVTELPIPRPLHKVGDVRDVCRTRVKSVYDKRIVLDGSLDEAFIQTNIIDGWIQIATESDAVIPESTSIVGSIKSSYLKAYAIEEVYSKKYSGISVDSNRRIRLSFKTSEYPDVTSVETARTYLSAHPLTVYYQSTTYDGTNGLDVCLTEYETGYIESYADESITTAWISSTGALSTGAEVAYVLSSPETYATDPLDIDNAAGPLTVMTGGELEVRMTDLVGTRSDVSNNTVAFTETAQDADITSGEKLSVLFGKIKKRFSVVNKLVNGAVYPNLGTNTNFPDAINQRGKTTYTGDNTSPYCIDRWRISNGTTYTVGTFTLSAATYANRACGMWQSNEMGAHQLSIGDDITVSIYANGKLHTPTMKVIDRDLYDAFANVPAGYDCDDFEIVLCTYAKDKTKYNLGIYPKKLLSVNYIKWEKGSAATPYVPKSYRAELAECQRYFYRIYNSTWQTGSLISGWGFIVPFDTPVPMRSNPTINFVDAGLKVFAPSGWVNATSAETYGFNKNCARVNVKLIITLPSDIEGRSMLVTGIESFSADF